MTFNECAMYKAKSVDTLKINLAQNNNKILIYCFFTKSKTFELIFMSITNLHQIESDITSIVNSVSIE